MNLGNLFVQAGFEVIEVNPYPFISGLLFIKRYKGFWMVSF